MDVQILISVIVPVYNTEPFLRKCLNSIVNQTFKDIEIIIVNDGSTDNSLDICKEYAKKDCRIVLVDKKNEGLEQARISGLKIANGLYVAHVDSDDWLPLNAFESLYKIVKNNNVDIVVGNFIHVFDKFSLVKKLYKFPLEFQNKKIEKEEFLNNFYEVFFGINTIPMSMWGRLYKREFVANILIDELGFDLGEDLNYNIQVFPKATSIYFLNEVVYFYRYGGMTTKFNGKIIQSAIKMYELKKKLMNTYNLLRMERFIIFELKNYLRTYIEMMIVFKPFSKDQALIEIDKLLKHEYFIEVIEYYSSINSLEESFVVSMMTGNCEALYTEMEQKVKKEKYSRAIKRMASKLLN